LDPETIEGGRAFSALVQCSMPWALNPALKYFEIRCIDSFHFRTKYITSTVAVRKRSQKTRRLNGIKFVRVTEAAHRPGKIDTFRN